MKNKLKLKEIVVAAMISVIMGVVFTFIDSMYQPIQALLGPLGGDSIGGLYYVSALLSIYIIRKPGSALMGSLFTGIVNLLLGSPYGIHIIIASALQGIGVEIVMAITRYKKYNFVTMALSSLLAALLVTCRDYFIFGLDLYAGMIPLMLLVRAVSAVILGAILSIGLGKPLNATGVLRGFAINSEE